MTECEGATMSSLDVSVIRRIGEIEPADWNRLAHGRSLYQSYPWLSWAESNCGATVRYVTARDRDGRLLGALPAYLLTTAATTWNAWYDPLSVFVGEPDIERREGWFPLLLLGSLSGYHSDVLLDTTLGDDARRDVTGVLAQEARVLAGELGARSTAIMYATKTAAEALMQGWPTVTGPLPVSANTRIPATWPDLDAYVASFPGRRRYNVRRELRALSSAGHRIAETTLSQGLDVMGPLLGNVHRKHGAADTDEVTTAYLRSQADHLDDASLVFLELADDRPVGFSLSYVWGDELNVRIVGFDYQRSAPFAYFALAYYLPLQHAMSHRLAGVNLGPGTYQAKAGRGAALEPTFAVIWPPDAESASWFESERRPTEDLVEAQPWLQPT